VLEVAPTGLAVSCTPHKAYVWDLLNHFSLPTQFSTLLAGAQGLLAHPVDAKHARFLRTCTKHRTDHGYSSLCYENTALTTDIVRYVTT
jgi:hypothetical protein